MAFTLTKAGGGFVDAEYLSISNSTASPANTWYAGNFSTNGGGNSGWTFDDVQDFVFTSPSLTVLGLA